MKEGDPVQHLRLGRRLPVKVESTESVNCPWSPAQSRVDVRCFSMGAKFLYKEWRPWPRREDREVSSQSWQSWLYFYHFQLRKATKTHSIFLRPWITVWIVFLDWTFWIPVWVWNTWLSRLLIVHRKPYKYEYLCNQTVVLFGVQGRHIMPSFDSIFFFLLEVLGV